MLAAVNPFDPRTVLFARHAQHVVLVHFPIALLITGVGFDLAAQWLKRPALGLAAGYNFLIAALATLPVMATGLLAWRWQLNGHRIKGILLQHLILGVTSSLLIWLVWWLHRRAARTAPDALPRFRLSIELAAVLVVAVTAHLGGFLSGVNAPG